MLLHLRPASVRRFAVLTAVIALITLTGCGSADGDASGAVKAAPPSAPTTSAAVAATTTPLADATAAAAATTSTTAAAPAPPASSTTTAAPTTVAPATTAAATTTTVPPYSLEELRATIGPAIEVWAAAPSGPTYDAVAAATRAVLESGRPLVEASGLAPGQTALLLANLATYPGSDTAVLDVLRRLGPAVPTVALPVVAAPQPFVPQAAATDPRFDTCKDAKADGYGPYRSDEAEYGWYRDADHDGVVCE